MVDSVRYNPLHGPRLAIAVIALCAVAVFARGSEPDKDRDRAARVALALAGSGGKSVATSKVAVAPMPRPKLPLNYAAGYARAADDEKPLVVFVGCPGDHTAPGAIVARVEKFADVVPPAVVIGYPVGDRLYVHATFQCPVTEEKLTAAVKAAAKKISDPPAKAMPAPAPIDWTLRADPAPKGDDKCGFCVFVGQPKNKEVVGDACPNCDKCPHCEKRQLRDSLVRVKCGDGSGSGTVVWSADGKSVILTAAHVLSRGADTAVRAEGKWHPAQVLASDATADLAALLVSTSLPAAPVSDLDPTAGDEVTMLGVTSLWSKGAIADRESLTFLSGGVSVAGDRYLLGADPGGQYSGGGDSGGGVFFKGELVGVHCGRRGATQRAADTPYCAGAKSVRGFLKRVLKRDGAKTVLVEQPKAPAAEPAQPVPHPATAGGTLVIGGVTYHRGADGVYRSGCPGGKCPLEKPATRVTPKGK